MPLLWSVTWFADSTGYQCVICNRCRVAGTFEAECLTGEPRAEIRQQAAAKAVEMALEHNIPLDCVLECTFRYASRVRLRLSRRHRKPALNFHRRDFLNPHKQPGVGLVALVFIVRQVLSLPPAVLGAIGQNIDARRRRIVGGDGLGVFRALM